MVDQTLSIPRLVIAGCSSGSGKTTTMLSLAKSLKDQGLKVVCFKCGPDYLDPTYHAQNMHATCHNLDGWMMGKEAVLRTFRCASAGADIALIEGVMGLFDGAGPTGDVGSTAEIAKWLKAPVVLVVDASGMARSIDAIAHGFKTYDSELNVSGLIANRFGSDSHLKILRDACQSLRVLGGLPKRDDLRFQERHLGLVSAIKSGQEGSRFAAWSQLAGQYFDLSALLDIARQAPELITRDYEGNIDFTESEDSPSTCTIGYAYDDAFHFYYADNLNLLRRYGARMVAFSPLHDSELPECDGLYFGGGYPELFAQALSRNHSMIASIQAAAARDLPVYGECGGFMYLNKNIIDSEGNRHPMVGLLPGTLKMHDKLQALGYAEVEVLSDSFLGEAGSRFRGHEFRYSSYEDEPEERPNIYKVRKRRNQDIRQEGFQSGSVLGSYIHAHWASNPTVAHNIVKACTTKRMSR